MPRFFFHVLDGDWNLDGVGDDLPDLESAIVEARRIAEELLEDEEGGWEFSRIEIEDENGRIVGVVTLGELKLQ